MTPASIVKIRTTFGGPWLDHPGSDDVLLFFLGNGEVAADGRRPENNDAPGRPASFPAVPFSENA